LQQKEISLANIYKEEEKEDKEEDGIYFRTITTTETLWDAK
jgi:hypothetical protein